MSKYGQIAPVLTLALMLAVLLGITVPNGGVADAIEGTWRDASGQIKTVVNKVVIPAIDLILAVFLSAKLGMACFDCWKHGQFEWAVRQSCSRDCCSPSRCRPTRQIGICLLGQHRAYTIHSQIQQGEVNHPHHSWLYKNILLRRFHL